MHLYRSGHPCTVFVTNVQVGHAAAAAAGSRLISCIDEKEYSTSERQFLPVKHCSKKHTAALLLAAVVAAALGRQLALLLDLLHQQGERLLDVGARLGAVSRKARAAGPPQQSVSSGLP